MISAGVDEVGRGPLAGPVIAAAVILPHRFRLQGLADSKKISEKKRLALDPMIKEQALCWGIGRAEVGEIDRINIFNAALLAMKRAVEAMGMAPDLALVDGKWAPHLDCETRTIVRGDESVSSISAASIIAKVARDREMCELSMTYPGYGFNKNKGYPTAEHLQALRANGACRIHRRSFRPVRQVLSAQLHLGPAQG